MNAYTDKTIITIIIITEKQINVREKVTGL